MSFPTFPRRHLRALLLTLAAAVTVLAASASAASADPATGQVVLTLKQGSQSSLLRENVKVTPGSGNGATRTVKLKVRSLDRVGAKSKLGIRGALTFAAQGRKAKFGKVVVEAGAKGATVRGKHGKRSIVVFRAAGAPKLDGASLRLNGPLTLTGNAAAALRDKLALPGITAGKVGAFKTNTTVMSTTPVTPVAVIPPPPPVDPYPFASQCPVGAVAGGPGGVGSPPGTVDGIAPAPTFGAGTEQGVTGVELDWGFLGSLRGYVLNSPPPGTLQTLAGAEAVGAEMDAADSYFKFPVSGGSYERGVDADHADDKLVVDGTGTVLFCKSGHGFNVVMKNPTLTIDGDESRVTADLGANFFGTWYPFQRVDVAELDIEGVVPTVGDGGNSLVWEEIPAKLTADGSSALGLSSFYKPGAKLDPITVKTSLTRPLRSQCSVAEGAGTSPALVPALAPLPELDSPVVGDSGTINWGLRRATRASTAGSPGGSFHLFGGATESYPGNMGGGEEAAPNGGQGKFFRFPISSYEYDAGEAADLTDDRLIATSEASVSMCVPGGGNYGLMLAKPTLVIDGSESRLIANAYSWSGGTPNPNPAAWMGGRVEVVDLNPTGVDPVEADGKVSWGDILADNTPLVNGIPATGGFTTNALTYAFLALNGGTTSGGIDKVAAQIVLPTP